MYKKKSKVNLKKRKSLLRDDKKLLARNIRRYRKTRSKKRGHLLQRIGGFNRQRVLRVLLLLIILLPVITVTIVLMTMNYISNVSKDLPSPDNPFQARQESTVILASNLNSKKENVELYRLYDDENRDPLVLSEVPDYVKWAVLAAEDIDFYDHAGFDLGGLYRAAMYSLFDIGQERGGSTITQQLIKQTTVGSEKTIERKIRELLLAIQVEEKYSKDTILEMYLNTNNYGGNVYGLKTAAKFYFGKEIAELTLSEAALLARIPQNPANNSPTLSFDPKEGLKRAFEGRDFVLDQMKKNLDKINSKIESDENIVLLEEIEAAEKEEIKFLEPKITLKAGHFVFYVQSLLTKKPYHNGKPFTLAELQTGGYKVYTSLNTDIQRISEEEVMNGVNLYSSPRNGKNGAGLVVNPKNGDILAMVGSKNFYGANEGKMFEPKVNITTSLQSMGSSMKPAAYYKAFEMGLVTPGSYLPDVPISIGGYTPKNWDSSFLGYSNGATPRNQLAKSRNIPAVMLVAAMGIDNYTKTLDDFGYFTIAQDPTPYGTSLVLGGGDVTMVEHAQGYTVFANGGAFVDINPIKKITKMNEVTGEEEIVYERKVIARNVADPKAIYMVNHVLNYKNGGPGGYVDGRDFSGKTGTSELHKDTIYAGYTPEFVIVGWNGNNDNTPMYYGSWGENVTKPWVITLSQRIQNYFPDKTPFLRPGGITTYKGDFALENVIPNDNLYRMFAPPAPTPTPVPSETPTPTP